MSTLVQWLTSRPASCLVLIESVDRMCLFLFSSFLLTSQTISRLDHFLDRKLDFGESVIKMVSLAQKNLAT